TARPLYGVLQQEFGRHQRDGPVPGCHLLAHTAKLPKGGCAGGLGHTTEGKRVLVAVRLGQRESHEDWLDLGRDLTRRGLRSPWMIVTDGAPGLIKAVEELWPEADRGRCAVHKLRNVVAKLPKRSGLHDEI